MGVRDRLAHAWNAFVSQDVETRMATYTDSVTYGHRPDKTVRSWSNERTISTSVYQRMTIDIASVDIRHVRLDDNGRYKEDVDSGLNSCLTLEANIDQAARAFRMDIVMTMFDRGVAAIVPVDTTLNPSVTGSFDILTMRVGEIISWMPRHVKVRLYNEQKGIREDIILEKKYVAIVENPLFAVMNEPNSTLQRLIRKLNLLDAVDDASASGKLDIIIQLPYVIKSEARRQQADQRRKDIEMQLSGSKYGVAYTDGTEKITQLNRPAENQLLDQIKYLTDMFYSQLGITPEVMNGTADEPTMLNYYARTVEPVLTAIVESMRRTFITKTARTQGQSVLFFRDVFKLVPIEQIANMADVFSRNEILSSNELRQVIGFKPDSNPKSDKLENSNMPQPNSPADPQGKGLQAPLPPRLAPHRAALPRPAPSGAGRQPIQRGDSQNGS